MNPTLGEIIVGVLRDYLKRNNLKSLGQITAETVQNEINERVAPCWQPKKPAVKRKLMTDEEWLQGLRDDPANRGTDIDQQFKLAGLWCRQQRPERRCSRAFFVNWLIRHAQTVPAHSSPVSAPKKHGLEEPHLWREWMQRETPNSMWIDVPSWDSIPIESQRMIQGAMKLTKIA